MAHIVTFETNRLDAADEPPNPINPIPGHALLAWLTGELRKLGYAASEPEPEDWGWYAVVRAANDAAYLVGAPGEENSWTIQIHKRRALTDKLLGRNRLDPAGALSARIAAIVRQQADFENVAYEHA